MKPTISSTIHSYKQLIVWQKSVRLAVLIYHLTEQFPSAEQFGLTAQLRRSAISVPSNIAEGRERKSRKEFMHFLKIANGSCAELETQIEIAKQLPFSRGLHYNEIDSLLLEITKMLSSMLSKHRS